MSETPRLDTFDFDRDGICERDPKGDGDWMATDDVRGLFTREDAELLSAIRDAWDPSVYVDEDGKEQLTAIIAKIRALLPA